MSLMEGISPRGTKLDEVLQENFDKLATARSAQDQRVADFVFGLSEDRLAGPLDYATVFAPTPCYLMLETNFVLLTNCATESAYFQYVK